MSILRRWLRISFGMSWCFASTLAAGQGAPLITTFSPASGPPGTLVIISGSNLFEVASISFSDGVPAPVYGSLDDGTAVQTEVPHDAVRGQITVVAANGSATSQAPFGVISGPPIVEDFSPYSGPTGTWVSISGSGLVGVTSVTFNGVNAVFQTLAGLSAQVPEGAATGPITVTTRQGSATAAELFTVVPPAKPGPPIIGGFSPRSGQPRARITINGTNLVNIRSVMFNGVEAEFTQMVDDWLFTSVPVKASTGPITVVTDGGSDTTVDSFEVLPIPTPVIKEFSPRSGRPGTWVTIKGVSAFVTAVYFSGVEAEFNRIIQPDVLAKVPYAPSGPITLVTDGGVAVSSESFTVIGGPEPPTILGFSPGDTLPGARVTIEGSKFGAVQAVLFNEIEAEFASGENLVEAIVPPLAVSGPITVRTTSGLAATSAIPVRIFNSGQLGVVSGASINPVILGDRVTFSILVTNLTANTLREITLTNTFASSPDLAEDAIAWQDGIPVFNNLPTADIDVVRVTMSQGVSVLTNGSVRCFVGGLELSGTATIDIELEPRTPDCLHLLSVAVAHAVDSPSIYSGFLTSTLVSGLVQLWIRKVDGGQVEIAWPVTEPPLSLQSADQPLRTAIWTPVPMPVTVAERCYVRTPILSGRQFFRLVQAP